MPQQCNTLNYKKFSVLNMQKTLSQRVTQIISELKTDQVGLAKLAGVTKGAVNQWTTSKPTATMAAAPAFSIADKTNYSPRWLILGEGNERTDKTISSAILLIAQQIYELPPEKRSLLEMIFENKGLETKQIALDPIKDR